MQSLTVNDQLITERPDKRIKVTFAVDPAGERMPPIDLTATGGRLEVYKSDVHATGDLHLHIFGAGKPSNFAAEFKKQLVASKKHKIARKHWLKIIDGPDSPRRDRQLSFMERHVRPKVAEIMGLAGAALVTFEGVVIDWSGIDWAQVLDWALRILSILLSVIMLL